MYMKKKIIIMIIIGIICIPFLSIVIDHYMFTVSHYTVQNNKIPKTFEGYKILQLSDLHSKNFGSENTLILQKIQNEKPDIVVMTGDMINQSDVDFTVFLKLATKIAQIYPSYYIVGNHEQNMKAEKRDALLASLKESNVTILDNEKVTLQKGDESIDLYGLWYHLRYYKNANNEYTKDIELNADYIQNLIGESQADRYQILLTHNPLYFNAYTEWGANLVLSGHIHGGIARIPFIGGILSPEITFFPEYDAGIFEQKNTTMIVNRGLGYGAIPIRIFNMPEISVITLKSE